MKGTQRVGQFLAHLLLRTLLLLTGVSPSLWSLDPLTRQENLIKDLAIVEYWNQRQTDIVPVYYNHLLSAGYFQMPSARMGYEGEMAFGYSWTEPYLLWNGRCQLTDRLELSGNYRIFRGIADPILSQYGFGDRSDKGANVKFALVLPEDSSYRLPGVSVGLEDFLGTRNFRSSYVVATQVVKDYDLELSVGYGAHRIRRWFGGVQWMPLRRSGISWLSGLAFVAEYDATPYQDHKIELHPKGRRQKGRINGGIKYRLWDSLDFTLSSLRGCTLACSVSAFYNFGYTKGFVPKVHDELPYKAPINREPLGLLRPPAWFSPELVYAFKEQGLFILQIDLVEGTSCRKTLRISLVNQRYRIERNVRQRIAHLLAALLPENIDQVVVVIDGEGLPLHEYRYLMASIRRYGKSLCDEELALTAPMKEVHVPDLASLQTIYKASLPPWRIYLLPKTNTFFGSSRGKFKFSLGASLELEGYLPSLLYYHCSTSYTFFEDLHLCRSVDRLNPSQIINVRSDIVRYYRQPGLHIDEAYLQRSWNLGEGWFGRCALGLFEIEYGGIAGECLYYPVGNCWAVGVEGAIVRKRTLTGVGFSDKVRKLHGFKPQWKKFLGSQAFLNIYYDWKGASLELRMKGGKFLANDTGIRYEVSRYFPSGLRITAWYTRTNAYDKINGERYFDKGISFSMPLDIFYTYPCRNLWNYGMSAWLRDVGVISATGKSLYEEIDDERS